MAGKKKARKKATAKKKAVVAPPPVTVSVSEPLELHVPWREPAGISTIHAKAARQTTLIQGARAFEKEISQSGSHEGFIRSHVKGGKGILFRYGPPA